MMAVPDFQSFFKPWLDFASDGKEHSLVEAREALTKLMDLSRDDLKELLPSGRQTKYVNRVSWAAVYLTKAGLLERARRGVFQITDRGREVLGRRLARIDVRILRQYPEFLDFHEARDRRDAEPTDQIADTPEGTLEQAYASIRANLANEILERIMANSPEFFERLVVDLMVAMGYGGSRADAGKQIGGVGDEGVDGIIKEDRLGLDVVYLQAKRWKGAVGRPELQKFVGALHGKRAKKGVFITTGRFAEEARRYVEAIDPKVSLIDGHELAELMIDYDLGTTTLTTYSLKRLDSDYFIEE
ncbi:MAG: Mrr restriction system protein [Deltaproteobacteria bacterium ADurb.Bin072]|nr:MAG: Mrr restriction system protein [Deltaproteobacteria bacterium ADurb.Bin072]